MIHYSCDRCKSVINPQDELRYSVEVEVKAVFDSSGYTSDEDTDHLLELGEILDRIDDEECETAGEDAYDRKRYDLCCKCYKQYQKNPLGRETSVSLGFSAN